MNEKQEEEITKFFKAVEHVKHCCTDEQLRRIILALVNEDSKWEQILRQTAKNLGDIPSIIFEARYGHLRKKDT